MARPAGRFAVSRARVGRVEKPVATAASLGVAVQPVKGGKLYSDGTFVPNQFGRKSNRHGTKKV